MQEEVILGLKLEGKVALVTGGSRGIGKAICLRLAKDGADIVVNCNAHKELAENVANEIRALKRKALVVKADVSKKSEVDTIVKIAIEEFGKIDILVNNAGIANIGPFTDLTEEDLHKIIDINFKGVFFCSQAVAKHMVKRRNGKIISVASESGKKGEIFLAAYCASKFAVIGFTQAAALELGKYNINVNAVCPGIIQTDMLDQVFQNMSKYTGKKPNEIKSEMEASVPLGNKIGTPEDVAKCVSFLASDEASYITGEAINVTAGTTMQ